MATFMDLTTQDDTPKFARLGFYTPEGREAARTRVAQRAKTLDRIERRFREHKGGRQCAWWRDITQNSYSIEPRKPEPDTNDFAVWRLERVKNRMQVRVRTLNERYYRFMRESYPMYRD